MLAMEERLASLIGIGPTELLDSPADPAGATDGTGTVTKLDPRSLDKMQSTVRGVLDKLTEVERDSGEFQANIKQLSAEMRDLQSKSAKLRAQLVARETAVQTLRPFVETHAIPPTIVRELAFGEVNAQWRAALWYVLKPPSSSSGESGDETVDDKSTEPSERNHQEESEDQDREPGPGPGPDRDLDPTVTGIPPLQHSPFRDALYARAAERIREYYIKNIRHLRRPGQDSQVIQDELVNSRSLFAFLSSQYPEVARTIRQAYLNTMKWYYHLLLSKYLRVLERQPVTFGDKAKLLVGKAIATDSLFTSASSAKANLLFNVGARPAILSSQEPAITLSATAPVSGYSMERITRSVVIALSDNMAVEDRTLRLAFEGIDSDKSELGFLFNEALTQATGFIGRLVSQSHDFYGLLITATLLDQMKQGAPALFGEFSDHLRDTILAQVHQVLEANSKSIETAASKLSAHRGASESSPHPLTQLVAGMLSGVLQIISHDAELATKVSPDLRHLASVFEMFITKVSQSIAASEIFLFNNYFLVHTLLSDVPGTLSEELAEHFKLLTSVYAPKVVKPGA